MQQTDDIGGLVPRHERHIPFPAVFNFRDAGGGYPAAGGRIVARGRLYRADGLHRLKPSDLGVIRRLGIRTVLDLRRPEEIEEWGRFPVEHHDARWENLSMIETLWDAHPKPEPERAHEFLADRYADMLVEGAGALRRAFTLMTLPDRLPVVFHCAAGKDRTGVLAALTLELLGVPDDVIAHDYSLSSDAMIPLRAHIRDNTPGGQEQMVNEPNAFYEAPAPAMHGFLDRLRASHGSAQGYLHSLGLDDDVTDALRANLLELP